MPREILLLLLLRSIRQPDTTRCARSCLSQSHFSREGGVSGQVWGLRKVVHQNQIQAYGLDKLSLIHSHLRLALPREEKENRERGDDDLGCERMPAATILLSRRV